MTEHLVTSCTEDQCTARRPYVGFLCRSTCHWTHSSRIRRGWISLTSTFIERVSLRLQNPMSCSYVHACDNAPSHNRAQEANLRPTHRVMFQPSYSPLFNLCEGGFSIWKAAFKRSMAEVWDQLLGEDHPQSTATMMQVAEQSIGALTLSKIKQLHAHMFAILPSCIREEDINVVLTCDVHFFLINVFVFRFILLKIKLVHLI